MSYLDNIPSALRMHPKWMVCSADGSKWEKTPIDPIEGYAVEGRGKNNPEVWLSYDDAREYTRVGTRMMGFICTSDDEYTIIDLDDVENLKGKHSAESLERQDAILTWAHENGCYGEWSKSGNGCHIVVKGKLRGNVVKQGQAGFEAYGHNCEYVIITGRKIEGFGDEPIELPAEWIDYFNDFVSDSNSEWNQYGDGIDVDFLAKMDAPYSYDEQKLYSEKWAKVESWKNGEKYKRFRLGLDIGEPGEDASANDFDCLQACYSVLQGQPERPLAAARMFMALERADRIKSGQKSKRYLLEFSLPGVMARVDWKEAEDAAASESAYMGFGQAAAKMLAQANGSPMPSESTAIASAPNMKLAPQPKLGANGQWKYGQPLAGRIKTQFEFLSPEQVKALPPMEWVLEGIFQRKSVNAIYGWSGVGKSFLAIDLVAAIANGDDWFKRYTEKSDVSYLALEGQEGIRQRILAYEKGTGAQYPSNVATFKGKFNILDKEMVSDFIEDRLARTQKGGVIVIDTFSKSTPGINENDAGQMAVVVNNLEAIKDALDACVIIVHHSTKPNADTGLSGMMRGSGVLQAGIEGVIQVARKPIVDIVNGKPVVIGEQRFWCTDKVKEGKSEQMYDFDLDVQEVEEVERKNGEKVKITSCCVVDPASVANSNVPPVASIHDRKTATYSTDEYARGKANGPKPAKRAANDDSETGGISSGQWSAAIKQAMDGLENEMGKFGERGKHGAPSGKMTFPRKIVMAAVTKTLNPPNPDDTRYKKGLNNGLNYAERSGVLGGAVEENIKYLWNAN